MSALAADRATILAHLERITCRWHEIAEKVVLEIRALAPDRGGAPQLARFEPSALDMAADFMEAWTASRNIYCVQNPIREDTPFDRGNGAKDKDIAAAFLCWADCDDDEAAERVRGFAGPRYTYAVTTGRIPSVRPHLYWELAEPCRNLDAWHDMQRRIAAHFKSDRTVVNPSRIMRVAGTVTHPDRKKQARGYVSEVTTLRTEYEDERKPVEFERLLRVFPPASETKVKTGLDGGAFNFDAGATAMDRDAATAKALSGEQWNNHVNQLVWSYAAKGLTDDEILRLTLPLTLDGYSEDQTRREVLDGMLRYVREHGLQPEEHAAAAPSPLVRETPPAEPYPLEALGGLKDAAAAICDVTQAPPAICAQSVLGVAALASQGIADVETLHGRAPASLYLLTVAQSGERKSAADRLAMRPVRAFETELAEDYREARAAHRNRLELWQEQRKAILRHAKDDPDGARADLDRLGPEPEPPLAPSIVSAEPTLEGIAKNMPVLRAALGIFADEGGAFIGGHGMSSENRLRTLSGLSSLWDGSPVTRWRAGDGVASYRGRRLSVHIMAQPVAAAGLLADPLANGQGFLARFLMCEPASAIGSRLRVGHDPLSDRALNRFAERIGAILRRPLPLREDSRNELDPPMLALEPDARDLLQTFALDVERAQAAGRALADARPFASKAAEHAARLAAVLTIHTDPSAAEVSADVMADAVTLATFYLNEAQRLADAAVISVETAEAERLRRWLLESWPETAISAGDAAQRSPIRETARARKALVFLQQYGWLIPIEGGGEVLGKHRREAWRIRRGPTDGLQV